MKGKTYRSNGEYIEAMMKKFKLVDMRETVPGPDPGSGIFLPEP